MEACYNPTKKVFYLVICRGVGVESLTFKAPSEELIETMKKLGSKTYVQCPYDAFCLFEWLLIKDCNLEQARELAEELGVKLDEEVPGGFLNYPDETKLYYRIKSRYPNFKISDSPSKYPDGTPW